MIDKYFLERKNLTMVFVLVDSRIDPQDIDLEMINWLGQNGLPVGIIFTKTDKLTSNKTASKVSSMPDHDAYTIYLYSI